MHRGRTRLLPFCRMRSELLTLLLGLVLLVVAGGCSVASHPDGDADRRTVLETKTGLASYYGAGFQGKETASGETFDKNDLTAAHPSYPLGTIVRVTNLEGGGAVEVRITDRGPTEENQREGVIIDLTRRAAEQIGMVQDGRARVQVDVLSWGNKGSR